MRTYSGKWVVKGENSGREYGPFASPQTAAKWARKNMNPQWAWSIAPLRGIK